MTRRRRRGKGLALARQLLWDLAVERREVPGGEDPVGRLRFLTPSASPSRSCPEKSSSFTVFPAVDSGPYQMSRGLPIRARTR